MCVPAAVSDGLLANHASFLVSDRLHLGLCPEAVFITPQGVWKLGGLGLSLGLAPNEVGPRASVLCPYYVNPMARKVCCVLCDGEGERAWPPVSD